MAVFPNLTQFAFSFSHGSVKCNGRQFMGVSGVRVSQPIQEGFVYGTSRGPLKRSAGQLQGGSGQMTFADLQDGLDFIRSISPDPQMAIWTLEYTLVLENDAAVCTVECQSCRVLDFELDHQAGPEAVGMTVPFSFLRRRIDGTDLVLSPRALINAGVGVANNLLNLL